LIGHSKIDPHVIKLARRGALWALHDHPATADPAIEALELGCLLLDVIIESSMIFNISKRDLNRE
jgi:hypothetical protein